MPRRPYDTDPERAAKWTASRLQVGRRIKELRRGRGMTQEALALASGVSRNLLIDVESGQRSLLFERLFDIAEGLQVTADILLKPSDDALPSRGTPE